MQESIEGAKQMVVEGAEKARQSALRVGWARLCSGLPVVNSAERRALRVG